MLKARVLARRIYDPSEFRPVKDPHRKWAQSHFRSFKGPCFYGLEIFTHVNGLLLLRAQIMFRPVKGPLWAQAYQKNMKAYADLGPDIFSGLHANFGP